MVSALVDAARRARDRGRSGLRAAKLPLGEVEATLTAALAEPEIAEQVRSGRLIRAATYAGFGEVPRPRLRLVTDDDVDDTDGRADDGRRRRTRRRSRADGPRQRAGARAAPRPRRRRAASARSSAASCNGS